MRAAIFSGLIDQESRLYLILVVLVVSNVFLSPAQSPQQAEVITSEFLTAVDTGQIKRLR